MKCKIGHFTENVKQLLEIARQTKWQTSKPAVTASPFKNPSNFNGESFLPKKIFKAWFHLFSGNLPFLNSKQKWGHNTRQQTILLSKPSIGHNRSASKLRTSRVWEDRSFHMPKTTTPSQITACRRPDHNWNWSIFGPSSKLRCVLLRLQKIRRDWLRNPCADRVASKP